MSFGPNVGLAALRPSNPQISPHLSPMAPANAASQRSQAVFLGRKADFANAASLIGCLGQAHFPSFFRIIVSHPGHASLRSLVDALLAPLHACVGSVVDSPAIWRASRCAAKFFGFFHKPRPARTTLPGVGRLAIYVMPCSPPVPDGIQCSRPTCDAVKRPTFVPPQR